MFKRAIKPTIIQALEAFRVVSLTGPRQSGKTTLLRQMFKNSPYYNLELPSMLDVVKQDPQDFLKQQVTPIIIDEAQRFPELFSYIQVHVDEVDRPGQFILSGSQNFLLSEKISQSLAGRVAQLSLLPLSYEEYVSARNPPELWQYIFDGSYPGIYKSGMDKQLWFENYIATYIERDVRLMVNINNLNKFHVFLRMCAARHGQLLVLSNIATACGVSVGTIESWLNILEASYVVFRLRPYHVNFNKRLVKSCKLYFYDSGVVCHLLNIDSIDHLKLHSMRGAIFEGYVISEICKKFDMLGRKPPIYFWRSQSGDEVDCLIETGGKLQAVEIKSSSTYSGDLASGILRWCKISKNQTDNFLIYAGEEGNVFSDFTLCGWRDFINKLFHP
ncbi:MAG: ATP-binding protein [Coxiellaceae bacterium]|nr:ATP-binding protein [Coxiellaceae bacterium]